MQCTFRLFSLALVALGLCVAPVVAADAPAKKPAAKKAAPKKVVVPAVKPTEADVKYGDSPKQAVDFYKAESSEPTPVLIFIHGGGWMGGDKKSVQVKPYLDAGISVVSVEYRFVSEAQAAGIKPPVKWPLEDAARAVQFIRSKAKEWNLDKTKVALSGGSAGACTSLWLAFHDDLADPNSSDPVARESTRVMFAAVNGAQTNLDPKMMKEWMPNSSYGGHAFLMPATGEARPTFERFLAAREEIMPWIKEYSPYHLVTADDPHVALFYRTAPAMGQSNPDPTHSANFGLGLQEKCKELGVKCDLIYPGAEGAPYDTSEKYVIAVLKGK